VIAAGTRSRDLTKRMMICHSKMLLLRLLIGLYFLTIAAVGQSDYRQQLRQVENKLKNLNSELESIQKQEGDFLSQIEIIDKEISLRSEKVGILKKKIGSLQFEINVLQKDISEKENNIRVLKAVYEKQVLMAYIFARKKEEFLNFDFNAPLKTMRKRRYFEIISLHEEKLAIELSGEIELLNQQKNRLVAVQNESKNLKADNEKELAALTRKRKSKNAFITKLQRNKTSRQMAIIKLKDARQTLLEQIARLVSKNKSDKAANVQPWVPLSGKFSRNKGKLNWPINGKVVKKFGKYKDPVLKTTLKNTGIDIKANFGKPIRSVFEGKVSLITFMSGFGNTLILDHGGGYYSVYAHLSEIYVKKDEVVNSGDVIGTVGDSGSLTGPKLHFEIYANQQPVNPSSWLR
jgi:septal ring factor EnvC (AmiA/AmiB activator)